MKNISLFLCVFFISSLSLMAQTADKDFVPSGAPIFKVFWNYSQDFTPNAVKKSAFALDRAYLGYKYDFSDKIAAKVIFDVGNNTAGSAYTAFLKIAQLDWKVATGVKLSMGMIGLKQFNDQEDFWGYRYIYRVSDDLDGIGSSADLGVNAEFTLTKNLKWNVLVVNGEGFRNIQDTNGNQRIGSSLVYTPIKGLITKVYFDTQSATGSKAVTTMALFAGYNTGKFRFGAEYNQLLNGTSFAVPAVDHELRVVSFYSTYVINKKIEIFGRFDHEKSNMLSGATTVWNAAKDGNLMITGFQYAPSKGLKLALDYQGYNFEQSGVPSQSKVFINAEFNL
ncbi:hypothetical protein [Flavobacterium sp. WC2409]|uniref:Porin n=3 Tax=unclassified Flavobacterium TaxID=196869 RepID=A0AB39WC47_9FLAO